jgi:hypothetical protein
MMHLFPNGEMKQKKINRLGVGYIETTLYRIFDSEVIVFIHGLGSHKIMWYYNLAGFKYIYLYLYMALQK